MVLSKVTCSSTVLLVEAAHCGSYFRAVAKTKVLRLKRSVGHQGISAEDLQRFQADCSEAATN